MMYVLIHGTDGIQETELVTILLIVVKYSVTLCGYFKRFDKLLHSKNGSEQRFSILYIRYTYKTFSILTKNFQIFLT